jgi:hypothetical protein
MRLPLRLRISGLRQTSRVCETMLRERYAHLGQIRYRGEHVEFRIEEHAKALGERLEALTQSTGGAL